MTRLVPATYPSDTAYIYASKVVHDVEVDIWTVHICADNFLAGAYNVPLETIQNESPAISEVGDRRIYEGRILLSSGVIFIVNDRFILIQRDERAPSDPGKWTSPAGRCEHDPGTTAIKEFYEELVVMTGEEPVFCRWDGRSNDFEETYQNTLAQLGNDISTDEWRSIEATMPNSFQEYFSTVITYHGGSKFCDELLTYYDEDSNTLEFRFVLRITPSSKLESQLRFADGELNRDVELFTVEEVKSMNSGYLTPTDSYISQEILPLIGSL